MSKRIQDEVKIDIAIAPSRVTSSGTTSPYFKLDTYDRALFVWSVAPENASQSVTLTSTGTLYQALDASAATSAAAMTSGTAIISAPTKAIVATVTPGTSVVTANISITAYDFNGDAKTALTFYAVSTGTAVVTASRQFAIGDTADGTAILSTCCTNLAALINNATYGVPGLYGSATTTTVVIRALEPGENMFSITSSNTTGLSVTIGQCMGMIEVNASSLNLSSSFTHVALNVINDVSAITSAFIIRAGRKAKLPIQLAGAITTVGY